MPRQCESCSHRLRADLDIDLMAGMSQGKVGVKYGLSRASVGRHVRGGHVTAVVPAAPVVPLAPGATPQDLIRALVDYLHSYDVTALPISQRMAVVREQRLAIEALGKQSPATARTSAAEQEVVALTAILAAQDESIEAALDTITDYDDQIRARRALGAGVHRRLRPSRAPEQSSGDRGEVTP